MDAYAQYWVQRMVRLTGRHASTCRRWWRTDTTPSWARKLDHFGQDLGGLDPAWSGWERGGRIWSPEGWGFAPRELYAIPWLRQQIEAYEQQLWTHRQVDWIEGRCVDLVESAAG